MLKNRVVTAAVLIPLLVVALYTLSAWQLAGLFGFVILIGAWEWATLSGLVSRRHRVLYLVVVAICGVALRLFPGLLLPTMFVSLAWWLWVLYEITYYAGHSAHRSRSVPYKLVSGIFVVVPVWLALIYLYSADSQPPRVLLFLFVLVWVADTGAYVVGRAFGRTKLSPRISPGKSVEGLIGGLAGTGLLALLAGSLVWGYRGYELLAWILLCEVVAMFSVLGDLFESMAKRDVGVKDSGKLLPGHGGILDRTDSMTAAAPIFVLGWWLLEQMQ